MEGNLGHTNGLEAASTSALSINEFEIMDSSDVPDNEGCSVRESVAESEIPVLFQLVRDIYVQRLQAIESNEMLHRNEKNVEKLVVLEQYIQHIEDQNELFVSILLELELEAKERVKQMEKRLQSSARTTMEAAINISECDKEMRRIVEERLYIETLYSDFQQRLKSFEDESGFLRDQNFNLHHDVQALLQIIQDARSTGHWEMNCVTFCELTPEQVFGPVQSLSKDCTSESPQRELSQDFSNSIISQELIHSSSSSLTEGSQQNKKPRTGFYVDLNNKNEFTDKDNRVIDLQSQILELKQRLAVKEAECECHLWKFEMSMQQRNKGNMPPADSQSSGSSLIKCISLPDIGNIYSFKNIIRRAHSFSVFQNAYEYQTIPIHACPKSILGKTSEFQKSNSINKKTDSIYHHRRGQSEPHLFVLDNAMYVYKPCEKTNNISDVALQDSLEISLPPCQSFDLKFPTNSGFDHWSPLMRGQCSYYGNKSGSLCSCFDNGIESVNNDESVQSKQLVSTYVQTEAISKFSIGLQAAIKRINNDVEMADESNLLEMDVYQMIDLVRILKENLIKAEDKAEAKEMLLSQLRSHITSAVKEVELKDTAIENLEKKLQVSRNEGLFLNQQLEETNVGFQQLLKDLQNVRMLNDNLQLKIGAKEEKVQHLISEKSLLQEQKCSLLTQLDTLGDELELTKRELEFRKHKAHTDALQIEQQGSIIRNLQEALVQSKRAFDAACLQAPFVQPVSSSDDESSRPSRSSIIDI